MATNDVGSAIGAAAGAAAGAAVGVAAQRVNFVAETPVMDAAGGGLSGVTSTNFSVAPEEAENLKKGLEDALDRLQQLYSDSGRLQQVGSPGKDPYSGFATLAMRNAAGDDEGGYGWANLQAQQALQNTIKNIEEAIANYRATEEANQQAFRSGGSNS
jgi:hypothetical protein